MYITYITEQKRLQSFFRDLETEDKDIISKSTKFGYYQYLDTCKELGWMNDYPLNILYKLIKNERDRKKTIS